MWNPFSLIRIGSRQEDSHYEQQSTWQITLEGQSSLEKIVAACPKKLDTPPVPVPAPELTEEQKTFIKKLKEEQEMNAKWIALNGIQPLSGGWKISEKKG